MIIIQRKIPGIIFECSICRTNFEEGWYEKEEEKDRVEFTFLCEDCANELEAI